MTKPIQEPINTRAQLGLLTEEDVAATLRLGSVDTLAGWRAKKIGPRSIKLGKQVFYIYADLVQWVQTQEQIQFAASEQAHADEQAAQRERAQSTADALIHNAGGTKT